MTRPLRLAVAARGILGALAVVGLIAGCTADDGTVDVGHSHAEGAGIVSQVVGDGTEVSEVGYTLDGLQVRERADGIGELVFRIDDFTGEPVTDYLVDQTKELHLYLVDEDLTVFRHLHPKMADDGTWTAPFDVPDAGPYRVVAEFVAADEGGHGDHVVLGRTLALPAGDPGDTVATDSVVSVTVSQAPAVGPNGRLALVVRDAQGQPVNLGTYLGTYAHVTGFHTETGAAVHLHPLDAPTITEDGSELSFHSDIERAGDYRFFVQVRVDGFLHTVPVEITVARSA